MKKLIIGTAVAGGAALAVVHCRDHIRELLSNRHPQQDRDDGTP